MLDIFLSKQAFSIKCMSNYAFHIILIVLSFDVIIQLQLYRESNNQMKEKWRCIIKKSYVDCANHLLTTMPLDNPTIKALSSLNPNKKGTEEGRKLMLELGGLLPQVVATEEQKSAYDKEVRAFHIDCSLPEYHDGRIDVWWARVRENRKYLLLPKVALGLLTCFHGPMVEGSFSTLSRIVGPQCGRLTVETMDAVQTAKYHLRAMNKSSVEYFHREDIRFSPVAPNLAVNILSSKSLYEAAKTKRREEKEERLAAIAAKKEKVLSKKRNR